MATKEEAIKSNLTAKFAFLADKIRVQRQRRIFADLPAADLRDVLGYAMNHKKDL